MHGHPGFLSEEFLLAAQKKMVGMSWALSGRHLLAASPLLLDPDPQLLAVPLAKKFQITLPLSDVCVQLEQTEKQMKSPNERNLWKSVLSELLFHLPKQFAETRTDRF